MSTPKGCVKIVKAQRNMYNDPSNQGFYGYESIKSAMRRSVTATDPRSVLDRSVAKATVQMSSHYEAIASGFDAWLRRAKGTGIPAKSETIWTIGNLTITLRHLIGLSLPRAPKVIVLTYVKEPPLTQDSADLLLRIMEHAMPTILLGAVPMVVDTRRGKSFKLRANTNRADLDAVLAAEAAKYVTHWMMAA
ncbi:hypothetical protein [Actinosynnema sp. NPDC023587]|uniref:hypothetical protein n=1 Tax=Actinosynnema sp. NPDC023587 TaxID=3154695 RepID=UPI0033C83558